MAMVKIFSPAGWAWDSPVAVQVKVLADGRIGPNDRRDFGKRAGDAGAHAFARHIEHLKFAKDTIPVHLIAVGAKEAYGPNRNGDAFTEDTLKSAHDTFVKYAAWFRNHKNKKVEGNPFFGIVKASEYHVPMRRVELLVELPTTKEAAEHLGVTGPADREIEKLARGDDIAVSMACRVPYDVCSGCGNKARTRDEYCKSAACRYGGCADNLTRLVKTATDVHLLHVENPNPIFFDISNVYRPADRIAYGGRADWVKAAADGFFGIDGTKTAEDLGVVAPLEVIVAQDAVVTATRDLRLAAQIKLAHALAALESRPALLPPGETKRAFDRGVQPEIDLGMFDGDKPEKVATALVALAEQKVVLPLREFARLTKRAELAEAASAMLPSAYCRMIDDGSLERNLATNRYAPSEKLASAKHRALAARVAPAFSLERNAIERRCAQSVLRGYAVPVPKSGFGGEKTAADALAADALARDYACYKVAALQRISEFDDEFPLTAGIAILQNSVI